jgi:ArsR family transcriptional regulator, arsenate/arsenite/antimonite-responsive transcriptional repressor
MLDYERLTRIFKALAHPVRLGIVAELARARDAGAVREPGVIEIAERVEITRFAASFHLDQLREAGIVEKERVGTRWAHRLTAEALDAVDDWLFDTSPVPIPVAG